jgi:hypothetical protein
MQERSSAFNVLPYLPFSLVCVFIASAAADERQPNPPRGAVWYISNPAGMAVSPSPSRLAALRNKNCLALAIVEADSLPPALAPYYKPSLKIDFRMLFESGKLIREQWVFRDEKARGLVIAAAVVEQDSTPSIAFIERYNENGFIEEERLFDDKETHIKYFYKERILTRTETRIWEKIEKPIEDSESAETPELEDETVYESAEVQPPESEDDPDSEPAEEREPEYEIVETTVYTDHYRYSMSDSLRIVERVFQKGGPEVGRYRVAFPAIGLRRETDSGFVKPASTHSSAFLADDTSVSNALYTTDARGRVLSEIYRDGNRGVLVETKNTWVNGRISVVEQRFFESPKDENEASEDTEEPSEDAEEPSEDAEEASEDAEEASEDTKEPPEDAKEPPKAAEEEAPEAIQYELRGELIEERRIEYEYNSAGDRILEKNYNNGTLERTVKTNGNQEIEEIYMDGKIVLRVLWEGNRKMKEERIR